MTDPVTAYATSVMAGTTVAGPPVRAACQRHLRDLGRADVRFDVAAAQRVLDFFPEVLRLPKGDQAGEPFQLLPWQQFLVGSLYGWLTPMVGVGSGARMWKRARGPASRPWRRGWPCTRSPRTTSTRPRGMSSPRRPTRRSSPFGSLRRWSSSRRRSQIGCRSTGAGKPTRIVHHGSWSFLERTTSHEAGAGKSGLNPHLVVVDEYHEHQTATMMERYDAGMKDRPQPLRLCITNAGAGQDIPCWDEHQYAVRVADGAVEEGLD